MITKLHLVQKTVSLTCNWVPTGEARNPLICVWTGSKIAEDANSASSTDNAGRMHLCA